jgi:ubiquinone/menaquinone biosynthesis C-methylase UbiE
VHDGSEKAFSANPFDEPGVAARYEAWYRGPGAVADRLEKLLLEELLLSFPNRRTLLEVGCGTGHFTRWLGRRGLSTFGVDLSDSMLAEARRLGSEALVRADARALPFADRSFDLVALIATLEFSAEPRRALRECIRVARQGVIVGAFNRWSIYALKRRLGASSLWRRARFFGPYQMRRRIVQTAGHRARRVRWRAVSWSLPPRERPLGIPYGDFLGFTVELSPNP